MRCGGLIISAIDRLWLAYWQVLAKWRLQGWELKQFVEAWSLLIQNLPRNMWVTESSIQWLVEQWQISTRDVNHKLLLQCLEKDDVLQTLCKTIKDIFEVWCQIWGPLHRMWEKVWTSLTPQLTSIWENVLEIVWTYGDSLWDLIANAKHEHFERLSHLQRTDLLKRSTFLPEIDKATNDQISFLQVVAWVFKAFLIWVQVIVKAISGLWAITWSALELSSIIVKFYVTDNQQCNQRYQLIDKGEWMLLQRQVSNRLNRSRSMQ